MVRSVALGVMIVVLTVVASEATAQIPAAAPPLAGTSSAGAAGAPAVPATLPSAEISKEVRNSANPQGDAKAINDFIDIAIKNLLNGENPGAQQIGRRALIQPVNGIGSSSAPSAAFVNYYIAQLGKALQPVVTGNNVRARLNAGIVIHDVSFKAQDTQLQPLVLTLMNDKVDAVSLWGVKSAGAMIPVLVASNSAVSDPMIQGMAKTVTTHKSSAAIAQEVYQALSLGVPDVKVQLAGAGPVFDEVLTVLAERLKQYISGIPDEPATERLAVTFLTSPKIIAAMTPAQKTKGLQLMSDLVQLASAQFANTTERSQREQLAYIVSFAGKGLVVLAGPAKGDALDDALTKAFRINVNSNPAQVLTDAQALLVQLQKKYAGMKPAPAVAAPTTAPTAAATGH